MHLPTVRELNREGSCGEVSLMLVRCLMTSDLSWMYDLFKSDTLQDIIDVTTDLLRLEVDSGCCHLTEEQIVEFNESIIAFKEAIEFSKDQVNRIQPNPPHFDPNKQG